MEAVGGWRRVDRLAVGTGPGSFTGLRIGIATALGLQAANPGLELVGVCTLDALAAGSAWPAGGRSRLALVDARRGEVFAALYGPDVRRVWGPVVLAPDALIDRLGSEAGAPQAAGTGALRFRGDLERRGVEVPRDDDPVHRVSGSAICGIGSGLERVENVPPEPIYLRPPDAERWRERDTATKAG